MLSCPLGTLPILPRFTGSHYLQNDYAVAFRDGYPVAEGHTLVVPRQHVASVFDLGPAEQGALWQLVSQAREQLRASLHPDAFTVGVNDGVAAGQTVPHAHVHLIPRWKGDVPDPRGGVRWVIASKADYWSTP